MNYEQTSLDVKKIYDLSTFDKSKISKIKSKLLEYVF